MAFDAAAEEAAAVTAAAREQAAMISLFKVQGEGCIKTLKAGVDAVRKDKVAHMTAWKQQEKMARVAMKATQDKAAK